MPNLFNSLNDIATEYTVFETDQVLTASQLNSITQYLDDQTRLSRIQLIGTGVVCGLHVKFNKQQILISQGVAISSDGDLMRLAEDTLYSHYKNYDNSRPAYPLLYRDDNTMLEVYELLEKGTADVHAKPLVSLETASGRGFADWVVVLLMESYIQDNDLCSSTGCDNLGQAYVARLKPLLILKEDIERLKPQIKTPRSAGLQLAPLIAERVQLSGAINNVSEYNRQYNKACERVLGSLEKALPGLWQQASFLLKDSFKNDPAPGWITKLKQSFRIHSHKNSQYYYDFLKDIIETWNSLRDKLLADNSLCCPDPASFPKHILLGNLQASGNPDTSRMGFYPARTSDWNSSLKHSVFLAEKLARIIDSFTIPSDKTIRVTPSFMCARPLEDRAIPWYYHLKSSSGLLERWNYSYHLEGRDSANYSYHAKHYATQETAIDPLRFTIDHHDFFRVEGHIGQSVRAVFEDLQQLVAEHNLPFRVATVLLGQNKEDLVFRPGAGYTDIKRLHALLRKDLVYRLDDVAKFSGKYKSRMDQAVEAGTVKDDVKGNDGSPVKVIAESRNKAVTEKAASAKQKLDGGYQHYLANLSWQQEVNDVMKEATLFRYELGKVSKTETVTPFDGLIGSSQKDWLNWLDVLIKDKDDKADEKNLFSRFIKQYPGLEHTAGVVRGGTFVLVYNADGIVVGDLMLSHYVEDVMEPEVPEPPLVRPDISRDWWLDYGVQVIPSLDHVLQKELTDFKSKFDSDLENKLKIVSSETLGTVFNVIKPTDFSIDPKKIPGMEEEKDTIGDSILKGYITKVRTSREQSKQMEKALRNSDLSSDEKKFIKKQKQQVEKELSENIASMTEYMSVRKIPITGSFEGAAAMEEIKKGIETVKANSNLYSNTLNQLNNIRSATTNTDLAANLGNLGNFNP
jgi:hypothetical protein